MTEGDAGGRDGDDGKEQARRHDLSDASSERMPRQHNLSIVDVFNIALNLTVVVQGELAVGGHGIELELERQVGEVEEVGGPHGGKPRD